MPTPSKIWINTAEVSGDVHGAALCKELRERLPELTLIGMGGDELECAGLRNFFRIEEVSVMGFTEVLRHIPNILRLLKKIEAKLIEEKPDAIVVIDAPDFHFRLIKAARRLNIPVYYYISPKIWAWRQNRAKFIQRNVCKMISILPFEVEFYKKFGMDVDYVGNPLLDEINLPQLDKITPVAGQLGFMPGSRLREVTSLMPQFGICAKLLREKLPELDFCCAVAPGMDEKLLKDLWGQGDVPLRFYPSKDRYQMMRECELLLSASGTAVLESALIGTPTIITYKLSPLTFRLANMILDIKFAGLPNLIAGHEVFPELFQEKCDGSALARFAQNWLTPENKPEILGGIRQQLTELRKIIGEPGATGRAAELILQDLGVRSYKE